MRSGFNIQSAFAMDQANLTLALKNLITSLPTAQDKVLGACVYELSDLENLLMIANAEGRQSDASHHKFLKDKIFGHHIHLKRTSINQSLQEGKPVSFVRSGFSANHECLNVILPQDGRFDYAVAQIAFKNKGAMGEVLSAEQKDILGREIGILMQRTGIKAQTRSFHSEYARNIAEYIKPGHTPAREGFLLYCDIRNSSAIQKELGYPITYENFLRNYRARLSEVATEAFGVEDRGYGDDLWLMFPTSEMSEEEHAAMLEENVLPAIMHMQAAYQNYKSCFNSRAIQGTSLKFALSYGSHDPIRERNGDYVYEGKPFYRVNALVEKVSTALSGSFLAFDQTVAPYVKNRHKFKAMGEELSKNMSPDKAGLLTETYAINL